SLELESSGKKRNFLAILNRIKAKDIVIFSRQFSVMISANVALVQALKIIEDQTDNIRLKMIISEVADEVDSGSRLSESLEKRSDVFSDFYINVIKSGETSGKLDEVLRYLADEMEKDYDMMSKIKGAMIYPAFVFFGLGVVGVIMMVFVVPKLTEILVESGVELPITTRMLIGTSDILSSYWWLLIIIFVGIIIGFKYYLKTPFGRKYFDFIKLKVPIFGKLFQRIYLVRFTRSMNTLIVGGVAITKSLEIAADVVGNEIYKELIKETSKAVEDGDSISSVFINSKEIPGMVSQMMSVGEKTGKLDVVLEKITDFYSREINNVVANLMTLMEPIIMSVIGVAVGVMVAAIILPMYNLASAY
ncbi:MAG: type II secretion system F family protein, partial [Patescibacteria group bacterium]